MSQEVVEDGYRATHVHSARGSASYDELWNALTPAEREEFLRTLQDPGHERANQFLASEVLEREQVEPWREAPAEHTSKDLGITSALQTSPRKHGTKPAIMSSPGPLTKRSSEANASRPLPSYIICAVCIAYPSATSSSRRSLLFSRKTQIALKKRSLFQLVPSSTFLVDRKCSSFWSFHTSLSGVVTDLGPQCSPGHMDARFFSAYHASRHCASPPRGEADRHRFPPPPCRNSKVT
ncbi:hypothetical protein C8T65DRAFT_739839 [Cerioporus squamosus]|nr:hypothetical protein C8T65DRAFT_739839 [Cerioporus squamosus]